MHSDRENTLAVLLGKIKSQGQRGESYKLHFWSNVYHSNCQRSSKLYQELASFLNYQPQPQIKSKIYLRQNEVTGLTLRLAIQFCLKIGFWKTDDFPLMPTFHEIIFPWSFYLGTLLKFSFLSFFFLFNLLPKITSSHGVLLTFFIIQCTRNWLRIEKPC